MIQALRHLLRKIGAWYRWRFKKTRVYYLGLYSGDGEHPPEIQAPEYRRQPIQFRMGRGVQEVRFPRATNDWGVITSVVIFDSPDDDARTIAQLKLPKTAEHVEEDNAGEDPDFDGWEEL